MTLPPNLPRRAQFRRLLTPFSWIYSQAVSSRNARFDRGEGVSNLTVPVVSIGNLTTGGTGKTPLVIEFTRRLAAFTPRPVILTRGYAAERGRAADEVLEFHEALPEIPVVVNPDRVVGGQRAVREHRATCVILDDGFQHRRLARDLDIVLIDALDPWGGSRLLPAGNLREPIAGLARAGLIVLTRANQVSRDIVAKLTAEIRLRAAQTPLIEAHVLATGMSGLRAESIDPTELAYRSVMPVCGVGNPASFCSLVHSLAGQTASPLVFRDHYRYRSRDAARIRDAAVAAEVDLVLTTRKDWVKLRSLWSELPERRVPELARLDMQLELRDPEDVAGKMIKCMLESKK